MCKNSLLSLLLSLTNVIRVNLFYKQFYYSRLKSALPHRVCVTVSSHSICIANSPSHPARVLRLLYFMRFYWTNGKSIPFEWYSNENEITKIPRQMHGVRSNTGCPGFQWFLTKAMSHTDLSPCPFITTTNRLLFGYILVEWNGRIHLWLIYLYYVLTIHEY